MSFERLPGDLRRPYGIWIATALLFALFAFHLPPSRADELKPGSGEAHLRPVKLPEIKPPKLAGERTVVKLPATYSRVIAGGGGRYLIFHLDSLRQLAVLDLNEAKVVKYLPLGSDDITYTAGADKLVIILRDQKIIQRWNLDKFERELTRTLSRSAAVAIMGSASNGPILIGGGGDRFSGRYFLDLDTLGDSAVGTKADGHWDRSPGEGVTRASADGRVFGIMSFGSSPSGLQSCVITGNKLQAAYAHTSVGFITPSPDGQLLYTDSGIYTNQLKAVGTEPIIGGIPAAHGDFYVRPDDEGGSVSIHLAGERRPLISLPDIVEPRRRDDFYFGSAEERMILRLHYVPAAHLLVSLPRTNDQAVLHRVNLDEALDKSGVDYLFVTSRPPLQAGRGGTYRYALQVKSKRGSVQYELAAGPTGMKVSAAGVVEWQVPRDLADTKSDVILAIRDASGQEVFHTFSVALQQNVAAAGSSKKASEIADPAEATVPAENKVSPNKKRPAEKKSGAETTAPTAISSLLKITPAKIKDEKQTVKLPGTFTDIVPAAGGRYLILHLAQLRQLAVFDVSEAKVVKYLPVASDDITYTAGADKLVVLLRDKKILQRWNLATFERELTVQCPTTERVPGIVMGSNSHGPLLLTTLNEHRWSGVMFLDLNMKVLDMKPSPESSSFGHGNVEHLRASANGRVFIVGTASVLVSGNRLTVYGDTTTGRGAGWGIVPNADGTLIYARSHVFTSELKPLDSQKSTGWPIPSVHAGYYLMVSQRDIFDRDSKDGGVSVHVEGEQRPLITLSQIPTATTEEERFSNQEGLTPDKRFWFIPDAHLLVQVPASKDQLMLYHVDLEKLLEKSGVDYLFVSSRPPLLATAGQRWQYSLTVKSKRGGAKLELASGPEDMKLNGNVLTWDVPKDVSQEIHQVVVSLKDDSSQEIYHTFSLSVPEAGERERQRLAAEAAKRAANERAAKEAARRAQAEAMAAELLREAPAAQQAAEAAARQLIRHLTKSEAKKPLSPPRVWTDSDGNEIEAELVEIFAGTANLQKPNGQLFLAPIARLSEDDQKLIKQLAEAAAAERKKNADAGGDATTRNRLLQVGAGFRSYLENQAKFPPAASQDQEGRPLLSWRVHLLPYLGGERLYRLFRLDEPWDSEHNRKLIPFMPAFYAAATGKSEEGKTNVLGVIGDSAAFQPAGPATVSDLRNGGADLAALVAAGDRSVVWTKPDDWQWDDDNPLKSLVGARQAGFFAVMANGQVRWLPAKSEKAALNALFHRLGGEPSKE
jgi:hypothetical protein